MKDRSFTRVLCLSASPEKHNSPASSKGMKFTMKRRWLLLPLLWVIVIFSFSLQSGRDSNKNSMHLKNQVAPIVHDLKINYSPLGTFLIDIYHEKNIAPGAFLIRKAAHFTEYLIFGIIIMLTLKPRHPGTLKNWEKALLAGLAVAAADELIIQGFLSSGRTPRPMDICIDMMGFLCGIGIMTAMKGIRRKISALNRDLF